VSFTGASSALHTDHYELTMVEAALRSGVARRRAVFEVFARRLPPGRRFGVLAGIGRLAEALARFRFGPEELEALASTRVVGGATLEYLASYRFSGTIRAYAEGELFFPGSPVCTVEGDFAEALVLETIVLSILNHDSAIAAAAARMVAAAGGRPLIEMGTRRTHEEAGVAAARAAYVTGFATTSNLEAGRRYGVPTAGTAAHALVLAHADEAEAFAAQVIAQGVETTLLVDTYDLEEGIRTAVRVAGRDLGAIRIDSGDLVREAHRARAVLDALGATKTRIVVSGDLDEYAIEELAPHPVDAYGVGTKLVSGSGAPTANFVYKLVAIEQPGSGGLAPVAKRSPGKGGTGGRKWAGRVVGPDGFARVELLGVGETAEPDALVDLLRPGERLRPLQVPLVSDGEAVDLPVLAEIRAHHQAALAELRPLALMLVAGQPALDVELVPAG
jgi:nicotinate phosphoribosyltransferase